MKKIKLTNCDKYALVDDEDFEWLNQFNWYLSDKGYVKRGQYMKATQSTKQVRMHREIMKFPQGLVDHKNRDKLDNTRRNLRLATRSQNGFNCKTPSTNTTGYRWITWDKSRQKYMVSTKLNQKKINIGRFDTLEESIQAVKDKILPLLGEFVPHEYTKV